LVIFCSIELIFLAVLRAQLNSGRTFSDERIFDIYSVS
jgi:hypothetical protein